MQQMLLLWLFFIFEFFLQCVASPDNILELELEVLLEFARDNLDVFDQLPLMWIRTFRKMRLFASIRNAKLTLSMNYFRKKVSINWEECRRWDPFFLLWRWSSLYVQGRPLNKIGWAISNQPSFIRDNFILFVLVELLQPSPLCDKSSFKTFVFNFQSLHGQWICLVVGLLRSDLSTSLLQFSSIMLLQQNLATSEYRSYHWYGSWTSICSVFSHLFENWSARWIT